MRRHHLIAPGFIQASLTVNFIILPVGILPDFVSHSTLRLSVLGQSSAYWLRALFVRGGESGPFVAIGFRNSLITAATEPTIPAIRKIQPIVVRPIVQRYTPETAIATMPTNIQISHLISFLLFIEPPLLFVKGIIS